MNLPPVVPETPVMQTPQIPTGVPNDFTPAAVQQLGCGNCQPQLAAASTGMALGWKIAIAVVALGGVFGLVYFATRPRGGSFPARP